MAGIKVGAHPLVVAVAMGLLGPGAVLDEFEGRPGHIQAEADEEEEPPTAEDFARIEDLWYEVRTTV